jgi:hypothetical protein
LSWKNSRGDSLQQEVWQALSADFLVSENLKFQVPLLSIFLSISLNKKVIFLNMKEGKGDNW